MPARSWELLEILLKADARDQITTLLSRDPAARVSLDDTRSPVWPPPLKSLLQGLQEAGAHEQGAALVERLPRAGMFGLFCQPQDRRDRFRFGREADGRPVELWDWDDLELWLCSPDCGYREATLPCRPTADPSNSQGKSGQFPVRTPEATLQSPVRRSDSSQSSVGQDYFGRRCPVQAKVAKSRSRPQVILRSPDLPCEIMRLAGDRSALPFSPACRLSTHSITHRDLQRPRPCRLGATELVPRPVRFAQLHSFLQRWWSW